MNCQEIHALVDETIENRLSASYRRKVNLHLSHCAECRAFLAAEKSEHAAWFRALNDISDIPPPATSSAAFAARLVSAAIPAAKRAGSITVPLWFKRAAVLAVLCGGVALAAWIGGGFDGDSRQVGDNMESRLLGGDTPAVVSPKTEGEEEMKPKQLAAVMSAATALAATPSQGTSFAEATFDSFSSEFRTSVTVETDACLSRYRTIEDSDVLASFDSREPSGLIIVIH